MSADDAVDTRARENAYAASIIALHLCVAVPLALYLNIWIDEAYSLRTTSRDLGFAIQNSQTFEEQPPLYFALLWVWRRINESIPFARMSSVLMVAVALWFTYLAARRWLGGAVAPWALAAVALNTFTFYGALEIRPYSMVLLCSALLVFLYYEGFYAEQRRVSAQTTYAAVALASLYTHYFLGFMLAAGAGPLLAERRWRRLAVYCGWMALVGALFIPGFHINSIAHDEGPLPSLLRTTSFVVGRTFSMPLALTWYPGPLRWAAGTGTMAAALASAWIWRARLAARTGALWIIVAIVSGFYFLAVKLVMGESVFPRHSIVLLIPTTFALFAIIGPSRRVLRAWLLVTAAFDISAGVMEYGHLAKVGDFRRVARYIEAHEKPGQTVAIVASHAVLPLEAYYRGTSQLAPLPERDDLSGFTLEKWQLQSVEQVRRLVSPLVSSDGMLWVFADRPPESVFLGTDMHFSLLEDVLRQDFVLVSTKEFYHAKVRLYQLRVHELPAETVPAKTPEDKPERV